MAVLKSSEAYSYSFSHFFSFFFFLFYTFHTLTRPREEKHHNACPSVNPALSLCVPSIFHLPRMKRHPTPSDPWADTDNRELLFNSEIAPRDTRLKHWRAQMGLREFFFHVSLGRRHSIARTTSLRKFIVSLGKFDRD